MASCIECHEDDRPGRIVELSYCGHRACMEFRRTDCRAVHTRTCPFYCAAVGWTPIARRGRDASQMTPEEAAWIREHVWTQAMRKTAAEVPGHRSSCACEYGLTSWCQHGQCDRCRRGTPLPSPAGYVCGGPGGQTVLGFAVPYEHPTRSATGRHRTDAAMVWYADRICRWVCPCPCHQRTRGEQAPLFDLAASA